MMMLDVFRRPCKFCFTMIIIMIVVIVINENNDYNNVLCILVVL